MILPFIFYNIYAKFNYFQIVKITLCHQINYCINHYVLFFNNLSIALYIYYYFHEYNSNISTLTANSTLLLVIKIFICILHLECAILYLI